MSADAADQGGKENADEAKRERTRTGAVFHLFVSFHIGTLESPAM
jgi:hypothetical protein